MSAAPYIDSWHEKLRQAVNYRWRQARRAGAHVSRPVLEEQLGLDREQLLVAGLIVTADGCARCGRLLELRRVRLTVADPAEPPVWPTNLAWRTVPCPACSRLAA